MIDTRDPEDFLPRHPDDIDLPVLPAPDRMLERAIEAAEAYDRHLQRVVEARHSQEASNED